MLRRAGPTRCICTTWRCCRSWPGAAWRGLAQALLARLQALAQACGLQRSALVSVQGSQPFWLRQGYAVQALEQLAQRMRLASYGPGAVYMVRRLDGSARPA